MNTIAVLVTIIVVMSMFWVAQGAIKLHDLIVEAREARAKKRAEEEARRIEAAKKAAEEFSKAVADCIFEIFVGGVCCIGKAIDEATKEAQKEEPKSEPAKAE